MLALARTFAERAEFALNVRQMIIAARHPRKGKESFARRAKAAAKENDEFGFRLVEDVFITLSTIHPVLSPGYTRIGNFVPFLAEICLANRHAERRVDHPAFTQPFAAGTNERAGVLPGDEDSTRIVRAVYYVWQIFQAGRIALR